MADRDAKELQRAIGATTEVTARAADYIRRRLEAAEVLAEAAEKARGCLAEHIDRPHKGDSFEGHWGSDGFGCLDRLALALAAYREASK